MTSTFNEPTSILMGISLIIFLLSYYLKYKNGIIFSLIIASSSYFYWRVTQTILPYDSNPSYPWMWIVLVVEFLAYVAGFLFILMRLNNKNRVLEADYYEDILHKRQIYPSVDIFIPTYNEPINVVKKTIFGAKNIHYRNFKVWVLDDGKRPWLKELCEEMQVGYFTREDNSNAKAGNMNNAFFQTKGKFIAVFDADFFAFPEFLNRTVGFFYDPKIGAVQTPHHFYNNDPLEYNIGLYNEIGDEQRLWFDDILEARDSFNLATSCGSSSIVRRAALEEIGGFPIDTITEDYDMSIRFMENGLIATFVDMTEEIDAKERLEHNNEKLRSQLEEIEEQKKELDENQNQLAQYLVKLENISRKDLLTGLMNRLELDERVLGQIGSLRRYQTPFSALLLDIDCFKLINDTYGHDIGDYVLKELGKILKNNIRSTDVAGRWGGEEFMIICENTNIQSAEILAEKIRKLIHNYKFEKIPCLSVSIGVTEFTKDDDEKTFFKRLDNGLYIAKNCGRNKVVAIKGEDSVK